MMHLTLEGIPGVRHSVRTEEFQISFSAPFHVVFVGVLLTLELLLLWVTRSGLVRSSDIDWRLVCIVSPIATALLSAVGVAALRARFRYRIGPEGIVSYDVWRRRQDASWDEMRSLSRVGLPGLTYIRIRGTSGERTLWLPLFVKEPWKIHQIVQLHAGGEHPLSELLHRHVAS